MLLALILNLIGACLCALTQCLQALRAGRVIRGDGIAPHRAEEAGDCLADSASLRSNSSFSLARCGLKAPPDDSVMRHIKGGLCLSEA